MLLLEGGRLLCPLGGLDGVADLWVADGRILAIGNGPGRGGFERIDCRGAVVAPGFTDLGTSLCDPGLTWREDLQSGSLAGAAGGFTRLLAGPATDPVVDGPSVAVDILSRVRDLQGARVLLAGALTMGLGGHELAEVGLLLEAGCTAISDGGVVVGDSLVLRNALQYLRPFGAPVLLRPGEPALEARGHMHEGSVSLRIGLRGLPAAAEEIGLQRILTLARLTGTRVHVSPISSARGVAMIAQARAEGVAVTAGVAARALVLTDQIVADSVYHSSTRLSPPLRGSADREALRQGVLDGTIGCVGADHIPWSRVEKDLEYANAEPGAMGLETALGATLEGLGGDVVAAVRALAVAPARVLGLQAELRTGAVADLVVFDPVARRTVAPPFQSRGCNEPLAGLSLPGVVRDVIVGGRLCSFESPQVSRQQDP